MVVVRIIGVVLLMSIIAILPVAIPVFSAFFMFDADFLYGMILLTVAIFLTVILLFLIVRFLLIKPEKLIGLLKLDTGFEEEKFELNLSQSTILKTAIFIVGGITLLNEIPNFIRNLFHFLEQRHTIWMENPTATNLFYSIAVIILACLLINYNDKIVQYIEKKTNNQTENNNENSN
jgi:preprotein translocase subunit SecG